MKQRFQTDVSAKRNRSSQTADHVVVNHFPVERGHLPRTTGSRRGADHTVVLEVARSEPRSRKLPQSTAGGAPLAAAIKLRQRTESASQPEEPVMKRSQRKRQRQIAEHSMKPKTGDGRWRTILRGQNPSEQIRSAEKKEAKEHSQQQAREEHSQQQAREEHSQQQARQEHSQQQVRQEHNQQQVRQEHSQQQAREEHSQQQARQEHSQQQVREEHSQLQAREEHSQLQAREEQGYL